MRVVHVDESNLKGTAQSSFRIHSGLREAGIDSLIVTRRDNMGGSDVLSGNRSVSRALSLIKPYIDSLPLRLYPNKSPFTINWVPGRLPTQINELDPDIVNLHWIGRGFLRIEEIKKINAPIVWRFPDMWPFTGGCHYSFDCERYTKSCGSCPALGSNTEYDISRIGWKRKKRILNLSNITPVVTSDWLQSVAEQSSIFDGTEIKKIPNAVDTHVYKPIEQERAREIANLPKDKKILLFGAVNPSSNPRKGYDKLTDALSKLEGKYSTDELECVVFGSREITDPDTKFNFSVRGKLLDERSLAILYSAADVFLMPSIAEAFGLTVIESLACGTPVVAFEETGPGGLINHKKTGYLAKFGSPSDFCEGIQWVLKADHENLRTNARKVAQDRFDREKVTEQYRSLYAELA